MSKMSSQVKDKSIPQSIAGFIVAVGLSCCLTIVTVLAASSFGFTWQNFSSEALECSSLFSSLNYSIRYVIVLAGVIAVSVLIRSKGPVFSSHKVIRTVLLIYVSVQVAYVLYQDANQTWYSDAHQLLTYARKLAEGGQLSPECLDYLQCYPFQSGFLLFETVLFYLFSLKAPLMLQLINVSANAASLLCLYHLGCYLLKGDSERSILAIVLGLFVPAAMYASFMYGNQIGLAFALAYVDLNARALYKANNSEISLRRQMPYLGASLLALILMYWCKSTYILLALAMLVVWLINMLMQPSARNFVLMAIAIVILLLANLCSVLPQKAIEQRYGVQLGEGMPKALWIAIGLQNDSVLGSDSPGWWGPYALEVRTETNNDYEEMNTEALVAIDDSLREFSQDPSYAFWFFANKLASEWLCPDFQAQYFAVINYKIFDYQNESEAYVNFDRYGFGYTSEISTKATAYAHRSTLFWVFENWILRPWMDVYQTLIYVGAVLAFWTLLKQRKNPHMNQLVLPVCFIVGFAVYVLWEAKAQYLMPFFMALIPLAIYGFSSVLKSGAQEKA